MFVIARHGDFTCQLVGDVHCGVEKMNNFSYACEVAVTDSGLDNQGFVIDNAEFEKYFKRMKKTGLSCELIACNAARHFVKMALKNSPDCVIHAKVRIGGLKTAHAEYTWLPGDSLEEVTTHTLKRATGYTPRRV